MWCTQSQLTINISKCAVLHLGRFNSFFQYYLAGSPLPNPSTMSDLGVLVDKSLTFSPHISSIVSKARARCAIFLKRFISRDPYLMVKFFNIYVRPILEYNSSVWSPCSSMNINLIEGVQRYFTSKIAGCVTLPYQQRLTFLSLHSLNQRRLVTDLSTLSSLVSTRIDLPLLPRLIFLPPSSTRGHNLRILIPLNHYSSHDQNFISRTASIWNSLPPSIISASSTRILRHRLSEFILDPFIVNTISV